MTLDALPERPAFSPDSFSEKTVSTGKKIRTLIVDDQLLEREVMRRLLQAEPDIEIVGTSVNGREAVEAIQRLKPDLAFLDVQMPELDGFGVVSNLNPADMPVVVFVTANEEFARKAFDVAALDYLIKPCRRDRLKVALHRVRRQIQLNQQSETRADISDLDGDLRPTVLSPDRIAVKTAGRILLLRLADISWVEAADNYVKLHVGEEAHVLRDTMGAIETRLPADRFLRISRSAIVNMEHIRELQPLFHGEFAVVLQNDVRLTLTRNHRDKLHRLGL
ncbi:MAG: LytR/AlgR family response regulator transcription factor [Verrucomicrobiota bacterium]